MGWGVHVLEELSLSSVSSFLPSKTSKTMKTKILDKMWPEWDGVSMVWIILVLLVF